MRLPLCRSLRAWRKLAVQTWERNSLHQIVTFGFDDKDRLIGRVQHPAECLDAEELRVYVETLAWECDRFEVVISGEDAN